jgi:D-amino-acid oxidase
VRPLDSVRCCRKPTDTCGRSTNIDQKITHWILERCRTIAPELLNKDGEFDVLSTQVGLRPSREGGPRIELEWLDITGGGKELVCHNYGHSHSG